MNGEIKPLKLVDNWLDTKYFNKIKLLGLRAKEAQLNKLK
jgi:hypothetical protein